MKSKLTPFFGKYIVDDIVENYTSESNTYIGIGRDISFGSSASNVANLGFSTIDTFNVFRNLTGLKKISASDMRAVIPRVDWVTNTVYDQYKDDIDLYSYLKITDLGTVNANVNVQLAGNVSIAASNVVIGNGTSFLTYVFPGDQILVNSATKTVVSVTNNNHLLVNSAFANTNSLQTITLVSNSTIVVGNSANFSTTLSSGNVVLIGDQTREVVSVRSNKVISLNTALVYSNSNIGMTKRDNTHPYFANNFYVRNTRDQVFKCLYNVNRANSTIEPTIDIDGQLPENPFILTGDGYKWKYLYTIPPGLKSKFFNATWMPVINENAVTSSAVDGRLDIIEVLWGGSGHLGGGNSNTSAILSVTQTDGSAANLLCSVANGVIGNVTILSGGSGYTTGKVTVTDTSRLGIATLGGTVNVSGALIRANISNTSNQSFLGNVLVNDIVTVNNESRNVISITDSANLVVNAAFTNPANTAILTVERSNAVFDIQFSPIGGHGKNAIKELDARTLMISVELNGTENGTIPVTDAVNTFDFNQICILRDPLFANGAYANTTNLRSTVRLLVSDPGVTNFENDETVYIGSTLTSASMVANVSHWDSTSNYLYINNISGRVTPATVIQGELSGAVSTILEVANSENRIYTGDFVYVENRKNVTRRNEQIDQIKIVLTF